MTLDEVFKRVVQAHLRLIAVCVLVPLIAVGLLAWQSPRTWVASVRIQVESTAPSSATEADALSSRVLALATTPYLVEQALDAEKLAGDPVTIANQHVTSQRLGESPIVEVSVSNRSKSLAREQVTAIATRVVQFMNDGNQQVFKKQLSAVRDQLAAAIATRNQVVQQVARQTNPTPAAQAQLSDAQATVDRLNTTVAQMEVSNADRDLVVLINGAAPQAHETSSSLIPRSALALLLGLLLGIALATLLETLRPRLAGTRSVARALGSPVIGTAQQDRRTLHRILSVAARRQGVETAGVVGVTKADETLVQELLSELAELNAAASRRATERVGGGAFASGDEVVSALRGQVRFISLADVGVDDEVTAGLVLLSSGSPLQREVDEVSDIIATMRWPVIGIVDFSSRRHRWSR